MMIGILMVAFLPPLIIAVVLLLERVEESLGATSNAPRPTSPTTSPPGHLGPARPARVPSDR
jgi:hypothetical protein